jgi:Ca2+-binding RTX toxin-like protein
LLQALQGTIITVNGQSSTNDLNAFRGVIHVDLMGGNDTATITNTPLINPYTIPTSVMGGDGADRIDTSGISVSTTIYGGSGNDSIFGGSAADEIDGGSGNDDIYGNAGNDSLFGGDGNDDFIWTAGGGFDLIDGGDGNDFASFTGAANVKNAFSVTPLTAGPASSAPGLGLGDANRVLVTHAGGEIAHIGDLESLNVNGGNDCDNVAIGNLETTDLRVVDVVFSPTANGGAVSTWATNLPDTITVTADSANQIGVNGLAVPVRIFNTKPNTAVIVHGGFGADTIEIDPVAETQATIVVEGGAGNDHISGGSIIIGGPGNNLLIGSDGPNTIVGGTGSDTINGLGAGDLLFGDAKVDFIDGGKDDCDYIGSIVITPTTTGAPDLIDGGDGDDTINGNIGNDTIHGGAGNNLMGEFTYKGVFFPEPGDDLIDALDGNNEVHSGAGNDNVTLGNGNNCVFGGDGNNIILVGNGNNRIVTGVGNDLINTGNGNNTIFAGAGNDTITTGSGNDVVVLGAGNDVANLNNGNDLAWGEDGNDFIVGGLGNDTIYGGNGNDVLWGGIKATQPLRKDQTHALLKPFDGDDVIAGEGGFDQVDGGTGSNIMDAGADNIRETIVGSGGWDTAYIHKNEGKYQDILKNHSKRYTLIPYGSMPVAAVPVTPVDCNSPINIVIPNPLSGATAKPTAKKALPGSSLARMFGGFVKK